MSTSSSGPRRERADRSDASKAAGLPSDGVPEGGDTAVPAPVADQCVGSAGLSDATADGSSGGTDSQADSQAGARGAGGEAVLDGVTPGVPADSPVSPLLAGASEVDGAATPAAAGHDSKVPPESADATDHGVATEEDAADRALLSTVRATYRAVGLAQAVQAVAVARLADARFARACELAESMVGASAAEVAGIDWDGSAEVGFVVHTSKGATQ
ncbi:MAG: hypothetical protein ACK5MT_04785, partial [Actinomycetales bacterium]